MQNCNSIFVIPHDSLGQVLQVAVIDVRSAISNHKPANGLQQIKNVVIASKPQLSLIAPIHSNSFLFSTIDENDLSIELSRARPKS